MRFLGRRISWRRFYGRRFSRRRTLHVIFPKITITSWCMRRTQTNGNQICCRAVTTQKHGTKTMGTPGAHGHRATCKHATSTLKEPIRLPVHLVESYPVQEKECTGEYQKPTSTA